MSETSPERPYDAITLDLFGTLLDFSIRRHEPPLVESLLCMTGSDLDADRVLDVWLEVSLAWRGREPFRTVHESLVVGARAVRDQLGLPIEPEAWAAALESLWADRPLQPGVRDALDRLEAEGYALAIVTNLDQGVLDAVLANTGLGQRIDVAVSSERARAYKPHPRPFRMALERLGVPAHRALHIGDSVREDRPGAAAAGMDFVLVEDGFEGVVGRVLGG